MTNNKLKVSEFDEHLYSVDIGRFLGFFMREKQMKELAKIAYKHQQELKKFFNKNKDEFLVSNWTLAYDESGEQHTVRYIDCTSEDEEDIQRRIETLSCYPSIDYAKEVVKVEGEFIYTGMDSIEEKSKLIQDYYLENIHKGTTKCGA